jgi:hypothetical protein
MSMSLKAMLFVLKCVKTNTPAQKLTLVCIADFADDNGVAAPSIPTIAAEVGVTRVHTQTLIAQLVQQGFLIVHQNHGLETGHGRTNKYTIRGVKEWDIGALKAQKARVKRVTDAKSSLRQGANSSWRQDANSSLPKQSGEQPGEQKKEKRKDSPTPVGAVKKLSEHQLITGIVQTIYANNPVCPNGMSPVLAGKIAGALRGIGKGAWAIQSLIDKPMSVDEAHGLARYVDERGVTPSLDAAKFDQLVFSFRASPRHDQLVADGVRAAATADALKIAKQQEQAAEQPTGEMVELDYDALLGIGA